MDAPLPLARPGREGVRRPGRDRPSPTARIVDEIAVADAHPLGARPFAREQYVHKFRTLAAGVLAEAEIERFLRLAQRLPELAAAELNQLTIVARPACRVGAAPKGIF